MNFHIGHERHICYSRAVQLAECGQHVAPEALIYSPQAPVYAPVPATTLVAVTAIGFFQLLLLSPLLGMG